MHAERTQRYELNLHEIDCNPAGDVLMATRPKSTTLEPYRAYGQVFSRADTESMPSHGPQDLVIKLHKGKQPPCGPIYKLSEKELDTLCSYLEVQLKRG
jgi:hypothetical protein